MQKTAEPDPRFKALKQHKKNWNLAAKEFIARMLAFKKALNGVANTKYSLPGGKLHQPIPPELASFLNGLSSNYEIIAKEALKIIEEQNQFAENKKQASQDNNFLISEGSSKLSRLWSYIKSPFISEENKKLRLNLLSSLASLEDMFKEFEGEILSSGDSSIISATKEIAKIENRFNVVDNIFNNLINMESKPQSPTEEGDGKEPNTENVPEDLLNKAKEVISDMVFASNIPGAETHRQGTEFDNLIIKFNAEQNPEAKTTLANQIIAIHERLLGMANQLHKQNAPSFQKLFEFVTRKTSSANNKLKSFGSNYLTRWLKKKRQQAKFYDEVASSRIQIQEVSAELRDSLDELLDLLEKRLDPAEIAEPLKKLAQGIAFIKFLMKPLQALLKGKSLDRMLDPEQISRLIGKETPDQKKQRLQRKYNNVVDRQILDTLFK